MFVAVCVAGAVLVLHRMYTNEVWKDDRCAHLANRPGNVKVLILGHSHTACSFDASQIDSAYSIASGARVSYYDAELLERYAPILPNLRAVIYPLAYEYEAGHFYMDKDFMLSQMFDYKKFYHVDPPKDCEELCRSPHYRLQFFGINHGSVGTFDSLGQQLIGDGFGNGKNVWNAPCGRQKVAESLARMARICKHNNLRFVVITFPGNSTYLKESVDSVELGKLYQLVDSIGSIYPVEYHCYLGDSQFANDSLFYDQTHLNHRGATLFAERVKRDFGL